MNTRHKKRGAPEKTIKAGWWGAAARGAPIGEAIAGTDLGRGAAALHMSGPKQTAISRAFLPASFAVYERACGKCTKAGECLLTVGE